MRKYFPQDKNYILYGAQFDQKEELLGYLIEQSKTYYQQMYNPLGLIDDTIMKIKSSREKEISHFEEFYDILAAIYRYKFGNNQLEFLFDGMDHFTKYSVEWNEGFMKYIQDLFSNQAFLKTVLQISVFGAEGHSLDLAKNRLNNYLSQHFDLKVYKYRGIVKKAA